MRRGKKGDGAGVKSVREGVCFAAREEQYRRGFEAQSHLEYCLIFGLGMIVTAYVSDESFGVVVFRRVLQCRDRRDAGGVPYRGGWGVY